MEGSGDTNALLSRFALKLSYCNVQAFDPAQPPLSSCVIEEWKIVPTPPPNNTPELTLTAIGISASTLTAGFILTLDCLLEDSRTTACYLLFDGLEVRRPGMTHGVSEAV